MVHGKSEHEKIDGSSGVVITYETSNSYQKPPELVDHHEHLDVNDPLGLDASPHTSFYELFYEVPLVYPSSDSRRPYMTTTLMLACTNPPRKG